LKDKKRKRLTVMPASGSQIARLQPRLPDVSYDAIQAAEAAPNDAGRRIEKNTKLVQAFGSTRRVRQLGQKAVTIALEGNVVERNEMVATIEDLGKQAEAEGLTTAQVLFIPLSRQRRNVGIALMIFKKRSFCVLDDLHFYVLDWKVIPDDQVPHSTHDFRISEGFED
jgi:hypothetical protein